MQSRSRGLSKFPAQTELSPAFDLQVWSYAVGLDSSDPKLQERWTGVLKELKSCGHIRGVPLAACEMPTFGVVHKILDERRRR